MKVGQIIQYQGDYMRYGVITKIAYDNGTEIVRVWATFRDDEYRAVKAYGQYLMGLGVATSNISELRLKSAKIIGMHMCKTGRSMQCG